VDEGLIAKDIHSEIFPFTAGSVYRVKRYSLDGKHFADDYEVETDLRK
jgi:hypothetical protein